MDNIVRCGSRKTAFASSSRGALVISLCSVWNRIMNCGTISLDSLVNRINLADELPLLHLLVKQSQEFILQGFKCGEATSMVL